MVGPRCVLIDQLPLEGTQVALFAISPDASKEHLAERTRALAAALVSVTSRLDRGGAPYTGMSPRKQEVAGVSGFFFFNCPAHPVQTPLSGSQRGVLATPVSGDEMDRNLHEPTPPVLGLCFPCTARGR